MLIAMGRPKGEYTWLNAYRPVRRIGSSIGSTGFPDVWDAAGCSRFDGASIEESDGSGQ
jgi:hypothetical protein